MFKKNIKILLTISYCTLIYTTDGYAGVQNVATSDLQYARLSFYDIKHQHITSYAPSANCPVFLVQNSNAKRSIIITNTSPFVTALNVQATNLWSDATQDASQCSAIPPGDTCTIFITAGNQVHPSTLINFAGSNTSTISTFLNVVAPLAIGQAWGGGAIYSLNPDGSSGQIVANNVAINEIAWDPNNGQEITGALDVDNGQQNTAAIVNQLHTVQGQALSNFAAGFCTLYQSNDSCNTYTGFYLPSQNQLGQLMLSNVNLSLYNFGDHPFWTSTQAATEPAQAYVNSYGQPNLFTFLREKNDSFNSAICIRDFSYTDDINAPA